MNKTTIATALEALKYLRGNQTAWFTLASNKQKPSEFNARIDAAIADLTTQAEPQGAQWTPVPDGDVLPDLFGNDFQVSKNGSELTMARGGTVIWADLPDHIRLCERLTPASPAPEVLPDYDHLSTIYKLITEYWSVVGPDEHYLAAKRALFALADALPAPEGVTQPDDVPDGPGVWAFEGHWSHLDASHTFQYALNVIEKEGELLTEIGGDYEPVSDLTGTWYKLTMPWQRPPASQG